MVVEVLLAFVFAFLVYKYLYQRHENFPPGPRGYPIFGALPLMAEINKRIDNGMDKIAKEYGPVSGVYLVNRPLIFVHGYNAVKSLLMNPDFDGRPDMPMKIMPERGIGKGIFMSDGESWRQQKRFALRNLRDFGFGKRTMDGIIHEEIIELISDMKSSTDSEGVVNSLEIQNLFTTSAINNLWNIATGIKYKHDDPKFVYLRDIIMNIFKIPPAPGLTESFPVLRRIAPKLTGYENIREMHNNVHKFLQETINEHQQNFDENHQKDFMDVYINKMKDPETANHFNSEQLLCVLFDFFLAGTDSTSNFVAFSIFFMTEYPDIQKKVQQEIEDVVGLDRLPSSEDKVKLVYTEATLREILRLGNVIPLAVPHRAMNDTILEGYNIPKGSLLFVSLKSVHMDPDYWVNPEEFKPERFLTNEGTLLKQDDHIMTFGAGHRLCPGETLARQTLFLFFTSLLQNFNFSAIPGHALPHPMNDVLSGISNSLPEYKYRIVPRN